MADERRTGALDPRETLPEPERRAYLDDVLRAAVGRAWEVPHYRAKLESAGLSPDDVKGLDDLDRIPITSKKEVRGTMVGAGTIPLHEAKRIFVSPGPHFYASQRRTDPPYERGKTPLAIPLYAMGFRENDIVLNTFGYHLTPGGFGLEEQLTAAGCAVVPAGPQNTDLQAQILSSLPVAGYVGTPTFLRRLVEKAREMGIDTRAGWSLEVAFVTAERLTEETRSFIEEATGALVRQIYGSADGLMPAYECWAATGMHLHFDQVLEVLDPESEQPVPDGVPGMVVATVANPNRPLLRFANQDLVSLRSDPCPCGRTGPRIERFVGRLDESTKVRGMFVYPEEIEQALARFTEISRWQAQVLTGPSGDDFRLRVELAGEGGDRGDEALAARIAEAVKGMARLRASVELVPAGTIAPDAKRLDDLRASG